MTEPFRPAALAAALVLAALPALADSPVLVELFTSQGCSSCPPADELLGEFAGRDDVVALGMHVDYWDYLGWTDEFARAEHTARQKAYSRANGDRMIYTPQIVVDGVARLPGNRQAAVRRAVDERHMHHSDAPDIALSRSSAGVHVVIGAKGLGGVPVDVLVATFQPERKVVIEAGENAGHHITYANVVSALRRAGTWDGTARLEFTVEVPDGPVAVFLQKPGMGEVIAAAQLR